MASAESIVKVILHRWEYSMPIIDWADKDEIAITLRNILNGVSVELSNITPSHLLLYCSVCSCGDIETAKILMYEIMNNNKSKIKWHIANNIALYPNIINTTLSGNSYPIISDGRIAGKYNRLMEDRKNQWGCKYNSIEYWVSML